MKKVLRCSWPGEDEKMIQYHDREWGKPIHDDRLLFELLTLEAAQAGLSWRTILYKREGYKKAFQNFDPKKISKYTDSRIKLLMLDPNIVRNRLKIESTISNAKAFLLIQKEFKSFYNYLCSFVDHKPVINKIKSIKDIPSSSPLSDKLSKELKKRGFRFVGSTIIYAFLQATGVVNDHFSNCRFRK